MSKNLYQQRRRSLSGIQSANLDDAQLRALIGELLDAGIHGLSFSPYVEGQGPGTQLTTDQIKQRLAIIAPHVRWVRTFACTDGHELIPAIAKERGIKTMVGVWIDDDTERNEIELATAIDIAKAGHADIVAVGNEVMLRGELSEDRLISYINRVREAVPDVPVGYVDAYFKFVDHPAVTEACDVILANCYPFWEGYPAEHVLAYMKDMYWRARNAANGKPVIISETGWPDKGTPTEAAQPSRRNAMTYFINAYQWAEQDNIDIIYFSAFDEAWKIQDEGDVGAYWGLWDADGNPKYT
ncbi:MAG: glycosyl hydrolase family 17 protein [Pseudomonadota bacterium]